MLGQSSRHLNLLVGKMKQKMFSGLLAESPRCRPPLVDLSVHPSVSLRSAYLPASTCLEIFWATEQSAVSLRFSSWFGLVVLGPRQGEADS